MPSASLQSEQNQALRRVIGVDPGLASCGYGIVDFCGNRFRLVAYGVIKTSPEHSRPTRLLCIYNEFSSILEEFLPSEAGMETLYFAKNVTSALAVAEARGVVSLCLEERGIDLKEYDPTTIKKAVTGIASADKRLVQEWVKRLLALDKIPTPNHAADALAVAITHINYGVESLIPKNVL